MSELTDAVTSAVMGSGDAGESGTNTGLGSEETSTGYEGTSEVTQAPEKKYFNVDEFGDHYVKIGDDEVALKDLPSGYMKGKDYTQKTQKLAQDQQRLNWADTLLAALDQDPAATLDLLRNTWGPKDQAPAEDVDPLQREVNELKGWKVQQEQATVRTKIEREVADLTKEFGEDFDFNEAAALVGSGRAATLTDAQDILYGRKVRSGGADAKAQDLARRVEAKRDQSVVATGGGSRAVEPQLTQFDTPADALRAAMKAAGAF